MALFGKKKNTAAEAEQNTGTTADKGSKAGTHATSADRNLANVLTEPRMTEKSVGKSEQNVYVFNVRKDATKYEIRDAIKQFYNVTPRKINTSLMQPRRSMSRMRRQVVTKPGEKKAFVYLKSGDTINLV